MFIYPRELLTRLKESWKVARNTPEEKIPRLPSDRVLRRLLEVAYHAGFMTEEARKIVFHLVYAPRERLLAESVQGLRRHNRVFAIALDRGRPFNESEILRLAPATDPTKVMIGVEKVTDSAAHDNDDGLRIWGLVDAGSSWWDFMHGESSSGNPPPDHLTISTAEPGNLTISRRGLIVLKLQRGEIYRPTGGILRRGPIADFFDDAVDQIYLEVCQRAGCRRFEYRGSDDYPQRLYLQYLERIIFHVRRKMHGGTIIVVPDNIDLERFKDGQRLRIKYPCHDQRAWQHLVDSLVLQRMHLDQHSALLAGACSICSQDYQRVVGINEEIAEINEALSDSVKFVAALSGVDGAVVMTDRLRLLGFGAEVLVSRPELERVKVSHDVYGHNGKYIPMETFGTRHRAAFRFCSHCDNSVAFVISQDGGVRAVRKRGDDIILWSDVNLGLFEI